MSVSIVALIAELLEDPDAVSIEMCRICLRRRGPFHGLDAEHFEAARRSLSSTTIRQGDRRKRVVVEGRCRHGRYGHRCGG